jgi:hypothetical protein
MEGFKVLGCTHGLALTLGLTRAVFRALVRLYVFQLRVNASGIYITVLQVTGCRSQVESYELKSNYGY